MPEYIEREAVRDALYEADAITMRGVAILNQFPAADVRPVVRGKWELDENGMDWNIPAWVCSKCRARNEALPVIVRFPDGEKTVHNPYRFSCSNFCPNCGADMRGGGHRR